MDLPNEAELLAQARHYTTMRIRSCTPGQNRLGFALGDGHRWIMFTFTPGEYERLGIKALTHKAVAYWLYCHGNVLAPSAEIDPSLYNYVD